MNKKYLEELYRIKFEIQQNIEQCKEDLKLPAAVCAGSSCNHTSHDNIKAKKDAYMCAEKYNDAAINFYFSIHS